MKFEIAILIDNRNFCNKFKCELKENSIIILLFFREDLMFKQIKLSLFILMHFCIPIYICNKNMIQKN